MIRRRGLRPLRCILLYSFDTQASRLVGTLVRKSKAPLVYVQYKWLLQQKVLTVFNTITISNTTNNNITLSNTTIKYVTNNNITITNNSRNRRVFARCSQNDS